MISSFVVHSLCNSHLNLNRIFILKKKFIQNPRQQIETFQPILVFYMNEFALLNLLLIRRHILLINYEFLRKKF